MIYELLELPGLLDAPECLLPSGCPLGAQLRLNKKNEVIRGLHFGRRHAIPPFCDSCDCGFGVLDFSKENVKSCSSCE